MKRILFLTFYLSLSLFANSQSLWNEAYNKHLIPITTTDTNVKSNDDLLKLDGIIGNKKIVALGEATHGTKEFVTTRHRLIKHLVTKHDFRVFVMEDNYAMTCEIDKHLSKENSESFDPDIIRKWVPAWRNTEIQNILRWIYNFNKDRKKDDMIKVYGCDPQNYYSPVHKLLTELKNKDLLTDEIEEGLKTLQQYNGRKEMGKSQKQLIYGMLDSLQSLFSNIDVEKDKSLKQLELTARTLEQSVDLLFSKGFIRAIKRDKYMAENCEHIYKIENNKKMIVWAHNQHIANMSDNSAKPPMGKHLKKFFQSDYFALGFAFYGGSYTAYNPAEKKIMACPAGEPNEKCIDIEFAKAQYSNFFIDFTNPTVVESMSNLLTKKVWSRSAGSVYYQDGENLNYRKHVLSKSYDGLIFIRNTSATSYIPYTVQ